MRTPIDQIKGNATDARKTLLNDTMQRFNLPGYYCHDVMNRMVIVEAGAVDSPNANDEGIGGGGNKTLIRAVYELKVERGAFSLLYFPGLRSFCLMLVLTSSSCPFRSF